MNREFAESDQQKVEMLNLYFASQTEVHVDDSNKALPYLEPSPYTLESKTFYSTLMFFLSYQPPPSQRRSKCAHLPYSIVFNRSLEQGYFPNSWKEANVSPIFKKDEKSLPSKYIHISLLCQAGKVMERCIHKYLYNYIVSNQILTLLQSDFFLVILLLASFSIHTTCSVKR